MVNADVGKKFDLGVVELTRFGVTDPFYLFAYGKSFLGEKLFDLTWLRMVMTYWRVGVDFWSSGAGQLCEGKLIRFCCDWDWRSCCFFFWL